MKTCTMCETELTGRQTKYCSNKCKMRSTNPKYQDYEKQKEKGRRRKRELIALLGGECQVCGYKKNFAVLSFHHRDAAQKTMKLSARELSNNRLEVLLNEVRKCDLLCANCHLELHNPTCTLE